MLLGAGMSLKLMCCHGVCLAVKLPCCFSTPIQAKKNGEEIKTNAEERHSISCCSVLSFASTPSTAWVSLQLTPRHGLGETASLVCVTLGKCVAFPRCGSLGEPLAQLLHEQQSRGEKGPFWEARSVGAGLEAAELMAILPLM